MVVYKMPKMKAGAVYLTRLSKIARPSCVGPVESLTSWASNGWTITAVQAKTFKKSPMSPSWRGKEIPGRRTVVDRCSFKLFSPFSPY